MLFICPKCSHAFSRFENNSAICENGHCFDKSRDGYYNFLLSHDASCHGDNKEMLLARRRFLDTGAYLPLAEAVSELALKYKPDGNVSVLDMGCGEGYYLEHLSGVFRRRNVPFSVSAFDISKDAVRLTAKRVRFGDFCVASAYRVPAPSESVDLALNMFSPLARQETVRLLRKDGIFIMAIPDKEHLFELKAAIYDTPYKNEVAPFELDELTFLEAKRVSYKLHLKSKEEILSLFHMTPYAYRTRKEDADRLLSLENLDISASFIVIIYKKAC